MTPCEVVRDVLPLQLSNSLLKLLLADSATWTRGSWYIGGKEHAAPRTSAYYTLDGTKVMLQTLLIICLALITLPAHMSKNHSAAEPLWGKVSLSSCCGVVTTRFRQGIPSVMAHLAFMVVCYSSVVCRLIFAQ